jgi:hypothetical protein
MPFDLIVNNFWVFLILASVYSAFLLKFRSRKFIEQQPELREGYDRLIVGELVYLNIPWVIAGVGIVFGNVPGFFSYFAPSDGNLFILAFQVSIVVLCLFTFWWVYFKGGAEFLVEHPGVFTQEIKSPVLLKLLIGAALAFGMGTIVSIWLS